MVHCVFAELLPLNPFPNKPWFLRVCSTSLTVGKGEIARNEQFLLFPHCFYQFGELFAISIKFEIVVCKLFQFGRVSNLSFGNGLMKFVQVYTL